KTVDLHGFLAQKLTDNGTRVPLIANCPGTVPAGQTNDDLIDFSDFLPTLASLAGADLPRDVTIDGRSFTPQLRGRAGDPREWVFTEWSGKAWVRDKRWKLYRQGTLYDLQLDPDEKHPLPQDEAQESKADTGLQNRDFETGRHRECAERRSIRRLEVFC
ncbi:MAG: hypothetical protein JJ992_01635, partial [Planctomycetes bacterium]|nr:hypothetical protein [Planctomycetota bacterium]